MAEVMGELTGTVTDPAGAPVAFAFVTTTNVVTGHALPAATGMDGNYRFTLPSGNYRIKFESRGYETQEIPEAVVSASSRVIENCVLEAVAQSQSNITADPAQKTAPSPSGKPAEPSLEDLGISPSQAKGNAREQALLDRRSHMLKVHQRLGLITIAHAHYFRFRRRKADKPGQPGRACRFGYGDGGHVFHHRLLCHLCAQDPRHQDARADPPSQDVGVDSRTRDDPYTHSGRDGFCSKEPRRKGSRDRLGPRTGGHRYDRGIWVGGSVCIV
jgi:hypothetical protein